MIELVVTDRCTGCNACVKVCPTNVFDPGDRLPVIARPEDCQTCFMCELYCQADALYVGPDCERQHPADEAAIVASGLLGQFRRESGWDEWADDPRYANEHWRMELVFQRAAAMRAGKDAGGSK
jgi:NAD-dependent dihydropyrimidine dehydrogenase PreA subunit